MLSKDQPVPDWLLRANCQPLDVAASIIAESSWPFWESTVVWLVVGLTHAETVKLLFSGTADAPVVSTPFAPLKTTSAGKLGSLVFQVALAALLG